MKKVLTALAFLLSIRLKGDDVKPPNTPMTQPFIRSVVIESENKRGSGFIIKTNLVVSAFHMLETDSVTTVNGNPMTILAVDTEHDLVLLETQTREVEPIVFATSVTIDQEVVCMSNPLGHTNMFLRGRVIDYDDGKIFTDMRIWFGSSGSAVYDLSGKFVGIAEAMQESKNNGNTFYPYGIITPAPTVAKFLIAYELRKEGKEPPKEDSLPEEKPKKAANAKKAK